jgi:murein DD-endopeptidase MepM/ murein hydrolase activator NlpD
MPEQDVLNPFINPLGDQTVSTPTTPAAVAPRREWNLYDFGQTVKNSAANIRQNYTLDSAVEDFATRNPNFAVGLPSLTVQEANKEFGLSLTGNPNEKVTRRWAENQVKKKEAQEYYQQVSADNPNNNLATGLVAGVATTLTSPLEVLLNIGTAGAVGFAAKSLMAAKALRQGSIAFKVGQAIAKPGVVREVTEAVVSSGISTTATALQAQQQDAAVFGPDGYGAQQAVFDTATSAGAALVLTALGKGIGKGIQASKSTLSKVVDPQRAGAEIANAAKAGVAPNPANAIDIPKVEQQLTVQNTNIEAHLKILEDAEKSLAQPVKSNIPSSAVAEPTVGEAFPRTPTKWPEKETRGSEIFPYFNWGAKSESAFQFASDIDEALFKLRDKTISAEDTAKLRGKIAEKTGLSAEQINTLSKTVDGEIAAQLKRFGSLPDTVAPIWRKSFDIPDGPAPPEPPSYRAEQSARAFEEAYAAQELAQEASGALATAEDKIRQVTGVPDIVEAQRKAGADILAVKKNIKVLEGELASLNQATPQGRQRATAIVNEVAKLSDDLAAIEAPYRELIDARKLAASVDKDVQKAPDYTKLLPQVTHPTAPIYAPNSLKQKVTVDGTAFVSPLGKRKVSSQFGQRHGRQHRGTDYAAEMGTPIGASRGGVVRKVGNQPNGAGNYVEIDHGGGWVTKYFHMSKINVTEGQKVKSGFEIGGVGNSGRSTGPHLHFEVWKDGKAVDPEMWLNKKTAIAEAAPASRDVPPVKFDDDAPVHLHPEDEVALYSKNMPEFSENAKTTTSKLMDDIANTVTIDPAEASPAVFRGQYEELAERMNVLAEYTGTVIDAPAVTRAFSEGGENARKLIAAVQKAPDAALPVITKILDDARSVLKMVEIRKAKELSTKLENGTIKSTDTIAALQATVAKELPLVLTAHRILEGMGQGRVTEELPLRYFMQMFGDNVSDFGKAVLGEIDAADNRPLYRLRRQAVGRAAKETAELSKLLGEAKKNQGVIERLSLADTAAMALTKQVDEAIAKGGASFEDTVAVAKQAIDERFKMYQESGLFDDASIRQLEGIRKDAQRGIDEGNFAELSKGGDKTDIVETTLRNNKEYTAALEKIKDILTVCASRGLGRG